MKNIKYISFLVVTAGILSACSNSNPFLQEDFLTNGEDTTLNEFYIEGTKKTEVKVISGMVQGSDEEGLTIDEAFGTNGELLLPFDQAFPYYMQNTKYDANSLLVKSNINDIFSIYRLLSIHGVSGYKEITKIDNQTSWYKLFLNNITSDKAINKFRNLTTKAQIFDLNYVLDDSSLAVEGTSSTMNNVQKSNETTIDNCGIDGANKNKLFKEQWYFKQLGLKESYKALKDEGAPEGGYGTVVAVIDTGVDIKHEDLKNNIWTNSLEIPNNGIDDDNNGYIDDVNGWNFVDNNNNPDDDQGHGTHVAGIIGAENNDVGVVGIAYKTKIMPLKAGDGAGYFTQDRIAEAIVYAYMNGADVINMSFGGTTSSLAVQDALEAAYTTSVLVAAAGNDSVLNEQPEVGEAKLTLPFFPASYSYVLGVMSVDINFNESTFTNHDGRNCTTAEYEVYAPGECIYSTIPNNRYVSLNGTSMAAPIISGIVALLKTKYSDSVLYSTKFFMGQIAGASTVTPKCIHAKYIHNIPYLVDCYESLFSSPTPSIYMKDYFIFDSQDFSDFNNGDGRLDAGETVYLAPVLFNRWGKAADVIIEFDTRSSISGEESKYILIENSILEFGEIGTYSTKDFLIYETNTEKPKNADLSRCLKIIVNENIPNNLRVPLNYKISYKNAFDFSNVISNKPFTIELVLNKGVVLPKMIKEDFVMTNDKLWIVNEMVQVGEKATLSAEPGTEIIFGKSDYSGIYGGQANSPQIVVYGSFIVKGTPSQPIKITHSDNKYNNVIQIYGAQFFNIEFEYCSIKGTANITADVFKNCYVENYMSYVPTLTNYNEYSISSNIYAKEIINSKISFVNSNLYYSFAFEFAPEKIINSIILLENNLVDTSLECYVIIKTIINSTFLTRGQNIVKLSFNINAITAPLSFGFSDFYGPVEDKINYIILDTTNINLETTKLFDFLKKLYSRAEDEGLKLSCDYKKHGTNECECVFVNNDIQYFMYDKTNIYLLDGTIISRESLSEFVDHDALYNIEQTTDDRKYIGFIEFGKSIDYNGKITNYNVLNTYSNNSIWLLSGSCSMEYEEGCWASFNALNSEELSKTDELCKILANETVFNGYGQGGASLSSNINIIANNLSSQININANEDYFYGDYHYDNLFNLNTSDEDLIDYIIYDGNDGFYRPTIGLTDETHENNSDLWPYITNLELTNSNGNFTSVFSNEEMTVKLTLNREMDTSVPIRVRFGSYGIYADYEVEGEYLDSKTWIGKYTLNTLIESGTQYFNISGGAALSDGFMEIEESPGRFSFVIDTTHSLSKNIFGNATENGISLEWNQDDHGIETIMGYNIYRSNEENGYYTKINKSIVSKDETSFIDENVLPGETYWYTFTVVLSDLSESAPSGKICVTARDTMSPNIYHSPVYEAYTGSKLTISCLISDNIGVKSAYLYYRKAGETTYKRILMNSSNDRFTASISASELSLDGMEYYIEASDGTNIVSKGNADNPYFVLIRDSSLINAIGDVDGDGSITVKDAYLILQHIYGEILLEGDAFTRADLNGDGILSTVEAYRILQYVNGNINTLNF